MFKSPVIGLVLKGGESKRFGSDKAQFIYHDRPQAEFTFDLLSVYCHQTFYSVKNKKGFQPQIVDKLNLGGPLNGILSAMLSYPGYAILAIPCDMPAVDQKVIAALLLHRSSAGVCYSLGNILEPFPSLWEPEKLCPLLNYIQAGGESAKKFIEEQDFVTIRGDAKLENINTPEERISFMNKF